MGDVSFLDLLKVSFDAGKKILEVYDTDFEVEEKKDDADYVSPLTLADKKSDEVINAFLSKTDIPILSEEGKSIDYSIRSNWSKFWLTDPLDGTKEFVKKNGEFTTNIALIENGFPVLGVIYVPVLDVFYFGGKEFGSYRLDGKSLSGVLSDEELFEVSEKLPLNVVRDKIVVVGSKSHMSEDTLKFAKELGDVDILSVGSSLKLCMVAENKADYYPRFAPTMEWDIGAGQAIVEGSGGSVIDWKSKKRFGYNKRELRNDWFLVSRGDLE